MTAMETEVTIDNKGYEVSGLDLRWHHAGKVRPS